MMSIIPSMDMDSTIKKLSQYVINHWNEKITLEICSKVFNYNSDYLGKLFRQETGESFVEFVTRIKMERAKNLLISGDYKNYEVSQMTGYNDYDHFSRLFKDYTGFSPSIFKKQTLTGNN